jgi:hypothetical protein
VARFRFVTADLLARWLGVSAQRANTRVRRLEQAGLLARAPGRLGEARAIYVTGRGFDLLGQPRRRPPRAETQRVHELAIVRLCGLIERRSPDSEILTERQARALERDGDRFSIDLGGAGPRRDRRHWPDLIVQPHQRRTALELEFSPKGTQRLASIVEAYAVSGYGEVRYVVSSPALAARIVALAQSTWLPGPGWSRTPIVVVPWIDIPKDVADEITAANGRG